jgi:hypothetical protein
MGMIRRLFRKDSMARQSDSTVDSYRLPRQSRPASHMTRQY